MTNKRLWSPTATSNNIDLFKNYINKNVNINTYNDLHRWSIDCKEVFWDKVWDFTNIIGEKKEEIFKDTKFFDNSSLNYTENCLQ